MSDEKLSPERAVRVLRAKAAELETAVLDLHADRTRPANSRHIEALAADISLVAELLADHIDKTERTLERFAIEVAARISNAVDCTCPRVYVGSRWTGSRNLHPDCPVHGEAAREAEDRLFGRDRTDG